MLGGSALLMEFAHKRLAHDIFRHMESDIFFELVRDANTDEIRARVKPAVIKVRRLTRFQKATTPVRLADANAECPSSLASFMHMRTVPTTSMSSWS
jgi:hypothetical protein